MINKYAWKENKENKIAMQDTFAGLLPQASSRPMVL
jgi:hypothetical protein